VTLPQAAKEGAPGLSNSAPEAVILGCLDHQGGLGRVAKKRTSEEGVRPEWRPAVKAQLNLDTWSYYLFDSADPKVPLSQSLRWH